MRGVTDSGGDFRFMWENQLICGGGGDQNLNKGTVGLLKF